MPRLLKIAGGKWRKFDRYEFRNGCIAPVPGSKSRLYDPWKARERPYEALAKFAPRKALNLSARQPEVVDAAIDWCNRYGLLGTLLHRVVSVTFPACWERLELAGNEEGAVFIPSVETYVHLPSGWLVQRASYSNCVTREPVNVGAPVSRDVILPPDAPRPGAVLIDLPDVSSAGDLLKHERLDETWAGYFPDFLIGEGNTRYYPPPGSPDFWSLYGEPVSQFIQAAYLLTNALEAICKPVNSQARQRGLLRLTRLASCASPGLELRDGALRQHWTASTLLSSLAMMAMDDLSGGVLRQCSTCRRFFQSEAYQAEYCSDACRRTMQKRRFREKHPDYERTARRRRLDQKES